MGHYFSDYFVHGTIYSVKRDRETGKALSGVLKNHFDKDVFEIHPDVLRALVKELDESEE